MVEALLTLDYGSKVIAIRPNNMDSEFFLGDMEAIMAGAPDRFHGIIIPKTTGPEYVVELAKMLDGMEEKYGWETNVAIEPLIETAGGVLKAYEIATASPRVVGIIFGFADYAADMGLSQDRLADGGQTEPFTSAKVKTVMAARAAGVHAIDNAYLELWKLPKGDDPGTPEEEVERMKGVLRAKNEQAASFGMDGAWVIHPQQADIVNECYTIKQDEVDKAAARLTYYHDRGGGSLTDPETGRMIDEATIKADIQAVSKGARHGLIGQEQVDDWADKSRDITGYDVRRRAA